MARSKEAEERQQEREEEKGEGGEGRREKKRVRMEEGEEEGVETREREGRIRRKEGGMETLGAAGMSGGAGNTWKHLVHTSCVEPAKVFCCRSVCQCDRVEAEHFRCVPDENWLHQTKTGR